MVTTDPVLENKKLRVLLDQYQRYIKKLELRTRENKRTIMRLEHEVAAFQRQLRQQGD